MSGNSAASVPGFLARFFASPNRLRAESKPELAHWIERVEREDPLPSVLPCWRADGTIDWYGLAFNERQFRALGESLTAFVGPSYSTFRGGIARLDKSDPIDSSVSEFTSGRAYKFRGSDAKAIWAALERMRQGWERMGSRERAAPAPVGRALRDFHMAIRAGLESEAESSLLLLRDEYHLDGLNLLYLKFELLASFARWDRLLELPELPDILQLRRPAAVTESILQAVYHRYLVHFEDPIDLHGAAKAFSDDVVPRFLPLLSSRSGMSSAETAKLFMLRAVSLSPPDLLLRDELLRNSDIEEKDRGILRLLASLAKDEAPDAAEGAVLSRAVEAAERSDFDRAFSLAKMLPDSIPKAKLLCECAFELGTLASRTEAIAAVRALEEHEREAFLSRRVSQTLLAGLNAPDDETDAGYIESLPIDWCSWLEHLDRYEGKRGTREIARRGATEWSVSQFLESPRSVSRLTELLRRARTQEAERALRDSLPHLLRFFQRDLNWPNPELRQVYRLLLDILVFSTDGGLSDLTVLNELVEAQLVLGPGDSNAYRELVDYVIHLWSEYASPVLLDWGLDVLELFCGYPRPLAEPLKELLQAIVGRCHGFIRRVEADQLELLRTFALEVGEDSLAEISGTSREDATKPHENIFTDLAGKLIVLYTLNESAARQVRDILEARTSTARFALSHDTKGSSRLRQLARNADLFVMAVSSSTHAATNFITDNRPSDLPLLRPQGKGSASMLRVIRDYLLSR